MAKQSRRGALTRYLRSYHFAPRYAVQERLALVASDGVRLVAHRLPALGTRRGAASLSVVVVHGLAHWSRTPAVYRFARMLAAGGVEVIVPDLRGHGRSGGECTFGRSEHLDVEAAVAAASGSSVVTLGVSLGGAAVLLHAARCGGMREVVAVSPPAWWGADTEGTRRIERWVRGRAGRRVMSVLLRTRVSADGDLVGNVGDEAASIRAASTLIAADPEDWYFGPEHATQLYERAPDPKELWWIRGAGHGSDLLTRALADRLLARWTAC